MLPDESAISSSVDVSNALLASTLLDKSALSFLVDSLLPQFLSVANSRGKELVLFHNVTDCFSNEFEFFRGGRLVPTLSLLFCSSTFSFSLFWLSSDPSSLSLSYNAKLQLLAAFCMNFLRAAELRSLATDASSLNFSCNAKLRLLAILCSQKNHTCTAPQIRAMHPRKILLTESTNSADASAQLVNIPSIVWQKQQMTITNVQSSVNLSINVMYDIIGK
mmetsp:Transcript_1450/g.2771  ORF Transcript_1450/g.2771 Transcript_1450/m.2771 type:complete len:220 (-) Transcript_1450:120-779(-)